MGDVRSGPVESKWTPALLASLSGLSYHIQNLVGPTDSSVPLAYGLNELGAVAGGVSMYRNGIFDGETGVVWTSPGWTKGRPSTVLGPTGYVLIYDGGPGGPYVTDPYYGSTLWALNRHGVAVGWRGPGQQNVTDAAIRAEGTTIANIPVPDWSHALDINDAGLICGTDWGAFVYDPKNGAVRRTGLPGTEFGAATAINNLGEVIGSCDGQAFFDSGGVKALGPAAAADLNDAGIVVGAQRRPGGKTVPVRCDARSAKPAWTDIPLPIGFVGGEAKALNRLGHVVGSCHAGGGGRACAFIHIDGDSFDLNLLINAPGWHLDTAQDINDRGQICGNGTFAGQPAAFLLSPPLVLPELPPLYRRWPLKPDGPAGPDGLLDDGSILLRLNQAATAISDATLRERVRAALSDADRSASADLADRAAPLEDPASARQASPGQEPAPVE